MILYMEIIFISVFFFKLTDISGCYNMRYILICFNILFSFFPSLSVTPIFTYHAYDLKLYLPLDNSLQIFNIF